MKIGQHQGLRAEYLLMNVENRRGYLFKTIVSENFYFFVFDEQQDFTHSATSYFAEHPDEWTDEFKSKCYWVRPNHCKELTKVIL